MDDDLAVLSHTQQQIQENTNIVAKQRLSTFKGERPWRKEHDPQSEVNKYPTVSVTLWGETIEEVEHFTYVSWQRRWHTGGIEADAKGKGGLSSTEEHLEIQSPFTKKQDQDFQYKCRGCSFVFTEQTHGGLQWPQQRGYRPLSTAA